LAFVVHGLSDDAGMSRALRKCLMDLRHALQPTPGFTGPLPRRIDASLSQLLPLHLFLTRNQRPHLSHKPTPAPGPDEEEQPNSAQHAAAAAGISEKLAFDPSWLEGEGAEEGGGWKRRRRRRRRRRERRRRVLLHISPNS